MYLSSKGCSRYKLAMFKPKNWGKTGKYVFPLFFLLFLFSVLSYSADIPFTWDGVEKIVAIGDIHGDYDHFERILRGIGLVDEELNWNGGKTHFVQLGDVMDRGPGAKQVFDLLMKLEPQAEAAGGKIHVLIGNHEEANIVGTALDTAAYVTIEQFISFLPEKYRESQEKKVLKRFKQSNDSNLTFEEELNKFWDKTRKGNPSARDRYHRSFNEKYGKWILTKNVIIKINDIVFTHGGVSEKFSKWDLKKINNTMRTELKKLYIRFEIRPGPRIAYQPNAPQWFRGLIRNDEVDFAEDVDRIMKNLNASYMVIAHTVRSPEVIRSRKLDRFQGRIWGIDTGISRYYGGLLSALIIENGKYTVWWGDNEN